MSAPSQADLQRVLLELRQAAEELKGYEAGSADRLCAAIERCRPAIARAAGLATDAVALRDRIVSQCGAVAESAARARQYPSQMLARADLLDRAGALAKTVRDLLARLDAPGR